MSENGGDRKGMNTGDLDVLTSYEGSRGPWIKDEEMRSIFNDLDLGR